MTTLLEMTFQGETRAVGPLDPAEEREVGRAAFPLAPPRDATERDDFIAFKMAPLPSGRVLLSAIHNRGDRDAYDRPVLRANGCVLQAADLTGALRDPAAVWRTLEDFDADRGSGDFERRVAELSIHASEPAFERFREALARSWDFQARLAAVLGSKSLDLYLGAPSAAAPELLQPAFGLLSTSRLCQLELAIGGEISEVREAMLGLPAEAPPSVGKGRGMLSRFVGRKQDDDSADVAVDFRNEKVYGSRSKGPVELARAITDPEPWPVAMPTRDRYQVLLECLDSGRSLFDVLPELDALRRAIQRLEKLSKAVKS